MNIFRGTLTNKDFDGSYTSMSEVATKIHQEEEFEKYLQQLWSIKQRQLQYQNNIQEVKGKELKDEV